MLKMLIILCIYDLLNDFFKGDEEHWHNLQRKKHNSPKRFKQKFIPKKLNFGKRQKNSAFNFFLAFNISLYM